MPPCRRISQLQLIDGPIEARSARDRTPQLSLTQALLFELQQRGKQIGDYPPRSGLDLDRDRHTQSEVNHALLDLDGRLVERDAGHVA
jgi:hypothetical protein